MDDEVIPRRDAIAGLGLMGTLLIALVGTIVFRIANSSRDDAGPPRRSIASVEVAADSALFGSNAAPVAAAVDSNGAGINAVRQAAHEQREQEPPRYEQPPASIAGPRYASPRSPLPEAPRFVAPEGR